jgi:hypothetical protein
MRVRDTIKRVDTQFVIGCHARGALFSEHLTAMEADNFIKAFPCLSRDNYAIYTVEEWSRSN